MRLCEDAAWPAARIVVPTAYDVVGFVSARKWGPLDRDNRSRDDAYSSGLVHLTVRSCRSKTCRPLLSEIPMKGANKWKGSVNITIREQ